MDDHQTIAQGLLEHLPGWTLVPPRPDYFWTDLVRADGATIRITVGGWRTEDRVVIRGCWPKFKDGNVYSGGKSAAITCDVRRPTKSIAADIARRLLPEYLPKYTEARAWVNRHETHAEDAQGVAERLALALGGQLGSNNSRRGDGVSIHHPMDSVSRLVVHPAYESGSWSKPTRVDFHVDGLDPQVALQVLTLIRDAEAGTADHSQVRVSVAEPQDDEIEASVTEAKRARR